MFIILHRYLCCEFLKSHFTEFCLKPSLIFANLLQMICYLFFGWLVPVIRGELGVAALHLLFTAVTFGLWQFIVAFLYNKQYMTRMLEKGYVLNDNPAVMEQARLKLGIAA